MSRYRKKANRTTPRGTEGRRQQEPGTPAPNPGPSQAGGQPGPSSAGLPEPLISSPPTGGKNTPVPGDLPRKEHAAFVLARRSHDLYPYACDIQIPQDWFSTREFNVALEDVINAYLEVKPDLAYNAYLEIG